MNKGKRRLNLTWEWNRKAFPFYLWLFLTQWRYCKFSPPVYGYMIYKDKIANCYLDIKTLNKAAQTILNKARKGSNFLKKWKKFVLKAGKKYINFVIRSKKQL